MPYNVSYEDGYCVFHTNIGDIRSILPKEKYLQTILQISNTKFGFQYDEQEKTYCDLSVVCSKENVQFMYREVSQIYNFDVKPDRTFECTIEEFNKYLTTI